MIIFQDIHLLNILFHFFPDNLIVYFVFYLFIFILFYFILFKENDVYFTGVLVSIGRTVGFMEKERRCANATILPLFLVAYTDRVFFESVKYFLEVNILLQNSFYYYCYCIYINYFFYKVFGKIYKVLVKEEKFSQVHSDNLFIISCTQ